MGASAPRPYDRNAALWAALALAALAALPWNGDDAGFFAFAWLAEYGQIGGAPALIQAMAFGRGWLAPLILVLAPAWPAIVRPQPQRIAGNWLVVAGLCGLAWLLIIALSIDLRGWTWSWPAQLFGALPRRNPGLGAGAWVYGFAALMLLCRGLAGRSACGGNCFVTGMLGTVIAGITLFVFYPLMCLGLSAMQTPRGVFAPELLWQRLANDRIWAWGGIVSNTILLGLASALASTLLALCFALITERTRLPWRGGLRALSILPIITPPFVVGLAVILLFGRNGAVNHMLEWAFAIEPSRWIYGFQGVWFAQTLAFTPIAYLVLVGVVQGINPSLEEAAATLRASRARVFGTVTLPLALPGIAKCLLDLVHRKPGRFRQPPVAWRQL